MFHSEANFHLDIERKAKSRAKIWVKCFNCVWKNCSEQALFVVSFLVGTFLNFPWWSSLTTWCLSALCGTFLPTPSTLVMVFAAFWALEESLKTCQVLCLSTLILPVFFWLWYSAKCAPPNDPTNDWHSIKLDYNFKLEETLWALWRNYLSIFSLCCNFFYDGGSTLLASKCFL